MQVMNALTDIIYPIPYTGNETHCHKDILQIILSQYHANYSDIKLCISTPL